MPPSSSTRTRKAAAPSSTAVATIEQREAHPIVATLQDRMPALARVLPRHMDPARFQSIVLRAVVDNPDLLGCTPESILSAVMQAAQEGLEPTGSIGGAWLVPFSGKATLVRDYRGLSRMAIRSGAARRIEAHAVREGDHFEYELGTSPRIVHRPKVGNDGDAHSYYAVAWLPDGSQLAEVMTRKQVEHIRSKSRSGDRGPWATDFDQMARKTVIKRLVNYLPLSPEQRERIHAEDVAEFGDDLAPVVRVSAVAQHGDLHERASQRAALLTGGTEQPAQGEPTGASSPPGGDDGGATTPAPVPPADEPAPSASPEPEPTTLDDATKAVYVAAQARGIIADLSADEAWERIDQIAREALPDTALDDLTVADWQAIRDRVAAGEFDMAVARPRSGS